MRNTQDAHGVAQAAFAGRHCRILVKWGTGLAVAGLLAIAGCTSAQLNGQSPVYAVMDQLSASSGVTPSIFSGSLASDVLTRVKQNINNVQTCVPTIFQDNGRVTLHMQLKDPGSVNAPTAASSSNTITFTRYHVTYVRSDGRNVPGVDVPYGFDGGMTVSLVGESATIGQITIVRIQAKEEAPLQALIGGGGATTISTIAVVTLYGQDAAGRSITVTGNIDVDFSDWGDPDC